MIWLPWRSQPASAPASEATRRRRWRPPSRSSATAEKHMSRTQKVWNQPGEAVNERPFQVRSIPASMIAAASPARRVWPWRARSTRTRRARPQSARLAGWSQSPSDIVDLSDGSRDGPVPHRRSAGGRSSRSHLVRTVNVVRTAGRVMTARHGVAVARGTASGPGLNHTTPACRGRSICPPDRSTHAGVIVRLLPFMDRLASTATGPSGRPRPADEPASAPRGSGGRRPWS